MDYAEATERLRARASSLSLDTERLPLDRVSGRYASGEVIAATASPPFDTSAMDGVALRAEWAALASEASPATLDVTATILAGDVAADPRRASAVAIMTGAPIPPSLDTVVKQEDVTIDRDEAQRPLRVRLTVPPKRGANVRLAGEDFAVGSSVVPTGRRLEPEALLSLANAGVDEVTVWKKPRVVIITTGDELRPLGSGPLPAGAIYDSNRVYLRAELERLGCEVLSVDWVPDASATLRSLLEERLAWRPDLVVSSGAVSVGVKDFVPEALEQLGAKTLFHRVAIRPGKPVCVAERDAATFFALPGNPVSAAVCTRFFIAPFLRALRRQPRESVRRLPLATELRSPPKLRHFFRATVRDDAVHVDPSQGSHVTRSLAHANVWAIVPEDAERLAAGSVVEVVPVRDHGESS